MKALLTSPTDYVIPTTEDRAIYSGLYKVGWIYEIIVEGDEDEEEGDEDEGGKRGYIFPSALHRWY
jgi:hypothetical protein